MAELILQDVDSGGAQLTLESAASGGDTIDNTSGNVLLFVKNGSASSVDITVTAQTTSTQKGGFGTLSKSDTVQAVAAGAEAIIGPFERAFNNSSSQVEVSYSDATSVEVAAIRY